LLLALFEAVAEEGATKLFLIDYVPPNSLGKCEECKVPVVDGS